MVEEEISQQDATELKLDKVAEVIEVLKRVRVAGTSEYHRSELKLFEDLAESLFELRLGKFVDGKTIKGFDKELYEVLNRVRDVFVSVLTGGLAGNIEKGLYVVKLPVFLNGHLLKPGDLIVSGLDNVLNAVIAGYIDIAKIERVGEDEGSKSD